jgi:hypothetical protein
MLIETKLEKNQTFLSTYVEFMDDYNHGFSVDWITGKILQQAKFDGIIEEHKDIYSFYFALAKAQWECGELQAEILNKVTHIINSGADIEKWKSLNFSDKDLKTREKWLKNFLNKIETANTTVKPPKLPRYAKAPPYRAGDCIAYQGENGKWYGSFCLRTKAMLSLIITLRIFQDALPVLQDFEDAEVFVGSFGAWYNSLDISWKSKLDVHETGNYRIVSKISIAEPDNFDCNSFDGLSPAYSYKIVDRQLAHEAEGNPRPRGYTLQEILKRGIGVRLNNLNYETYIK